ncbi:MAG: DNA-binding transcriptional ArsR family regulator [Limisphaerales bacterium]|jgi:DNA-binding transcriptional ArsR family regulator
MPKSETFRRFSVNEAQRIARLSPVFAALGDKTRLHIVGQLAQGHAHSIAQLAVGLEISHQGVTKHLKVLEKSGLVHARRVGRERQYTCDPELMHEARSYLDEVAQEWDEAIERLRLSVE